ncbi:sulfite exporter TauE/SafE family protein [Methylobacillus flagellatus]|uniref:sulfite exporter TauE/SafE family protein n=1 Tax=Methylobacillus flagellatus TaxID=405 RepID=UPI0010F5B3F2|nr:sulfite exporter TauE/SafE family protein [Methylobacillus flagellatus]
MEIGYIFSGLMVGILVGITGVGGGSLMTPLLVFLFNFSPAVAVGTDLLFAALTKTGGVWVHHGKHGSVDWKIVRHLAYGSLPAAGLTIWLLHVLEKNSKDISGLITFSLGVALILTSIAVLIRAYLQRNAPALTEESNVGRFGDRQLGVTIAVGFVLGALVTLSSVGAGALGTVALFFLYPRLPTLKVVGTDLAHAIPLTALAGAGHWGLGNVDFVLLGSLLIGSLPGIWLGSHLSARIPDKILRPLLALLLLLIGLKFVLK